MGERRRLSASDLGASRNLAGLKKKDKGHVYRALFIFG